ncbi:SGNH/GDSL hydrolase family protein [Rhodococcus fascians]|nr:SGNH/GDSL hydrolase family protein [Rhodococcus fascians]MBY4138176.1 SGNH/GDSL hydrolase family protein [Rhodococcus fascians]MBY4216117.1 SGNH/GDSL hydrolase family protein [Rhodococcus fascians]MBY4220652.1 SGNH/GDSL hydrolase family protein [Rhodococcus fascians]MBY4230811.1 SGNH/GDSL hydrolase family protein [Rhodococcus fascians]
MAIAAVIVSCSPPQEYTESQTAPKPPESQNQPGYRLPDLSADTAPFKMAILGDNTSKLDGGWTNIFANWLSTRFNRTVIINGIETPDATDYSIVKQIDKGSRYPIELWNAAVPNMTMQQVADRISILLPFDTESQPDLVMFSQGHNSGTRSLARTAIPILKNIRGRYPTAEILVILQNPWLEREDPQNTNALNVEDLKTSAKNSGFQTLDIYSAFNQDPRPLENLLDISGTFPSADGYILWSQIVETKIQ